MSGQRMVEVIFVFLISLAVLAVLDMTFGDAMDALQATFTAITPHLQMSAGWMGIANTILGLWGSEFFNSFMIVIIMLVIWVGKSVISSVLYSRQGNY